MTPATVDFDRAVAHGAALMLRLLIGIARADLAPMQAELRQVLAESGMPLDAIDPDPLPLPGNLGPRDLSDEVARLAAEANADMLRKAFAEGPPDGTPRERWMHRLVGSVRNWIFSNAEVLAPTGEHPVEWADRIARAVVEAAERDPDPAPPAEAERPPTGGPQAEGGDS